MGERILFVGMNNPLSMNPALALFPEPARCSGWNLWQLMSARTGVTQEQYLSAFHRVNMVMGRWDVKVARKWWEDNAETIRGEYDLVVFLGSATRRAAGVRGMDLPALGARGSLGAIPHPSGLNRWYNSPLNRTAAELFLEELYHRATAE